MQPALSISYFKNLSVNEELEKEKFWLDLKRKIYKASEDHTLVSVNTNRRHQSATAGEHAGILFTIFAEGIPVVYTYYEIWKEITKHLSKSRKKKQVLRINNLETLVNLCRFDLEVKKEISGAQLVQSKVLYDKYEPSPNEFREFFYEGLVKVEIAAEIIFEKKKFQHIYFIRTDGTIESYQRKKR